MEVKQISVDDKNEFLSLCKAFYESGATKRGYDEDSALVTFKQLTSNRENLWGYFIIDKVTQEKMGYALITSYWCNEEMGNVLILDELYINPAFRHQGIATQFMEWMKTYFKDKAVSATLEVLSSNITAKQLYAKEGFEYDGFEILSKKL